MHPDYKRVLPPPPGQTEWSARDYTNPLKHPSEGRYETFSGAGGPGDLRVTTDLSKVYPRDFLATQPANLQALERRAQSVESGRRGQKRAEFIARTRFFAAPDAYSIKDGYVSQQFPQAHPPTAPWRNELNETLRPQPKWQTSNEHPRIFSGTGQSVVSSSPYYSWRESDAAAGPRRALTDRARHSLYTADKGQEQRRRKTLSDYRRGRSHCPCPRRRCRRSSKLRIVHEHAPRTPQATRRNSSATSWSTQTGTRMISSLLAHDSRVLSDGSACHRGTQWRS
jgi:hypothetical protein